VKEAALRKKRAIEMSRELAKFSNSKVKPSNTSVRRKAKLKISKMTEELGKKRDALEEEAYRLLLTRQGYSQAVVDEEVPKFMAGGELVVSLELFEAEVQRLYLEKWRKHRKTHDEDSE